MLQPVTVQLILLMKTLLSVQLVQMLVNNVIQLLETVLNVLLTENLYQLVNVLLIISKLWFKVIFSVKFVMLDVMNVMMFSICALIVLLVPKDLTHQNVIVQMDI